MTSLVTYKKGILSKGIVKDGDREAKVWFGTSYSSVGKRQGLGSLIDTELEENIKKQNRKQGDGYIRIAKTDKKGSPIPTYISEHGMIFHSNEDKVISYVDEGYMKIQKNKKDQQDKYIEQMLELALTSDEEASNLCNLDQPEFDDLCAPGGGIDMGLPPACAKFQCNPDFLDYLSPTDPLFYGGIAKLRSIVKLRMPILKTESETGTTKAYVESNKE